jgi:hypothetical protein
MCFFSILVQICRRHRKHFLSAVGDSIQNFLSLSAMALKSFYALSPTAQNIYKRLNLPKNNLVLFKNYSLSAIGDSGNKI